MHLVSHLTLGILSIHKPHVGGRGKFREKTSTSDIHIKTNERSNPGYILQPMSYPAHKLCIYKHYLLVVRMFGFQCPKILALLL